MNDDIENNIPLEGEENSISLEKHSSDISAESADNFTHILRERMEKLSRAKVNLKKKDKLYLRFRLAGSEEYGIPYQYLKEILTNQSCVRIPSISNEFVGVINWRSKILPILDLCEVFSIHHSRKGRLPWVIVIESDDIVIGIVADEVIGNESLISEELVESLQIQSGSDDQYVEGIDKGVVAVLNVKKLLSKYESGEKDESDTAEMGRDNG